MRSETSQLRQYCEKATKAAIRTRQKTRRRERRRPKGT